METISIKLFDIKIMCFAEIHNYMKIKFQNNKNDCFMLNLILKFQLVNI